MGSPIFRLTLWMCTENPAGPEWADWLGTGTVANRLRKFLPFKRARTFVRGLGLQSEPEWRKYRKSGKMPANIPSNPNRTYAETGWAGMGDWLGYGQQALISKFAFRKSLDDAIVCRSSRLGRQLAAKELSGLPHYSK